MEEFYSGIREIVNDKVHGSTQIAINLMRFLSRNLENVDLYKLREIFDEVLSIAETRTSIILPINMLHILREAVESSISRDVRSNVKRLIDSLLSYYSQDLEWSAENGAKALEGYRRIFTLSYSSQVLKVLRKIKDIEVSIVAGWPLLDGLRASRELRSVGVKTFLYPDSSIYEAINSSDAIFLGCDAILIDGSIINRSGSRIATLISNYESIPSYVIGESLKLDIRSIWKPEVWKYVFEDVETEFQVFEKVEFELISKHISELGIDTPRNFVNKALRKMEEYTRKLLESVLSN
ncbi:MAG: hypothetical protein ABDH32_00650 [Candidatus Caldarchaeales archaeon]